MPAVSANGLTRKTTFSWKERGALLTALLLLIARASPQRDPRGHYTATAPGQPLCALQIHVTGFRNNDGTAGGVVFASPAGWPDDRSRAIVQGGFPIAGSQAIESFQVPPGHYGVVVIHDENSNMKLDRNFFGIPKEGFGFSNNPRVFLAAPSFQAAAVTVHCPSTQIEIKLIYK
jgi:uncharacterized protein (DUF2141 family)